MKNIIQILQIGIISVVIAACTTKQEHSSSHHHHDQTEHKSPENDSLYNEVMRIHDEVMPRMDDLYKRKTEIRKQLDQKKYKSEQEKEKMEVEIVAIEAAANGMMVWMREFNPPADSLGKTVMATYLQNELQKVKKVRTDILNIIE